jgi:hypothetical protein
MIIKYNYKSTVEMNKRVFEQAEVEESLGLHVDGLDVVLVTRQNNLSSPECFFPTSHELVSMFKKLFSLSLLLGQRKLEWLLPSYFFQSDCGKVIQW